MQSSPTCSYPTPGPAFFAGRGVGPRTPHMKQCPYSTLRDYAPPPKKNHFSKTCRPTTSNDRNRVLRTELFLFLADDSRFGELAAFLSDFFGSVRNSGLNVDSPFLGTYACSDGSFLGPCTHEGRLL